VTKRKFNEFTDLSHLLAATSNVIVADVGQVGLFVLALDGITLDVYDGILSDNTVLGRVCLHHLELDRTHGSTNKEGVALADRAVSLKEVLTEEAVEQVSGKTFYRIIEGENVNALSVLDIVARVDVAEIAELDTYVVTRN
jgi:hypothetical protein